MKKLITLLLVLAMLISLVACSGTSQKDASAEKNENSTEKKFNYPNGPVTILMPAKPGGDVDSSGRVLAKNLESFMGATMVPSNVADGSGAIAIKQLMDAEADGQILYNNFSWAMNCAIQKFPDYKWDDVIPVAVYAKNDTQILCVAADAPYSNAKELADYIVAHPGEVSFAVTLGSPSHYHCVAFEQACGGRFKRVDISSGSDKTVALLSGECNVLSSTYGIMKDYIESGKVKVIGSLAAERSELCPEIQTMDEQGIEMSGGVGFGVHYVVFVKAGTSQDIIDYVAAKIQEMVSDPGYIEDCKNLGFIPTYIGGQNAIDFENAYYEFVSSFADIIMNDAF